jgi:hypothetical protein
MPSIGCFVRHCYMVKCTDCRLPAISRICVIGKNISQGREGFGIRLIRPWQKVLTPSASGVYRLRGRFAEKIYRPFVRGKLGSAPPFRTRTASETKALHREVGMGWVGGLNQATRSGCYPPRAPMNCSARASSRLHSSPSAPSHAGDAGAADGCVTSLIPVPRANAISCA